jgi:2-hydroxy-6-oxonona-2,4-dienedioate hydrolase
MLKSALSALAIAVAVFAVVAAVAYTRAMDHAYERIRGRSTVIASPLGDIEYTLGGSGPAVLVIHGSGGGFDQGQFLAQAAQPTIRELVAQHILEHQPVR